MVHMITKAISPKQLVPDAVCATRFRNAAELEIIAKFGV